MRELHVVALSEDGRHLVLATRAGTASGEFRVALDERLSAAVRGELPAPGRDAPPSISPRDIQARLRDGEAPEQIAASAGVPLSRVERYAGPVLAELERMITGARAAVVTRPRLGPSVVPLGEAVEAHLADVAHLADGSVRWSARRAELGRWVVEVSWTARGRRRTAGWHYDPVTREVAAVDGPSAVLGHVEAQAAAGPAAGRAARPAAASVRGAGRAGSAAGPARPSAAAPAAGGKSVRSPAGSAAPASAAARASAAVPAARRAGRAGRAVRASSPSVDPGSPCHPGCCHRPHGQPAPGEADLGTGRGGATCPSATRRCDTSRGCCGTARSASPGLAGIRRGHDGHPQRTDVSRLGRLDAVAGERRDRSRPVPSGSPAPQRRPAARRAGRPDASSRAAGPLADVFGTAEPGAGPDPALRAAGPARRPPGRPGARAGGRAADRLATGPPGRRPAHEPRLGRRPHGRRSCATGRGAAAGLGSRSRQGRAPGPPVRC